MMKIMYQTMAQITWSKKFFVSGYLSNEINPQRRNPQIKTNLENNVSWIGPTGNKIWEAHQMSIVLNSGPPRLPIYHGY